MRQRVFETVLFEPLEVAVGSLGSVIVILLLAEAANPLETLVDLSSWMRQRLLAAQQRDWAERPVLH